MAELLTKFTEFAGGRRLALLLGIAAAAAGLFVVALWTQQPEMQVLFGNLSPEDAASIVEKLKEAKVPYEISNGGASILVPSTQVHDLRLALAGQGLPHGSGVGFEIFDKTTMGMSEFVQKLNYRRALQGELARTIAQLPEVERARVHLAIPERRLFSSEHERPRASVALSLRKGAQLSKGQIQGVVHLVASSVEGLQPQDVTVIDGHGRLLSDTGGEGPARLSGAQLEYQRALEKDIETRIQSMLERIVGVNKAVVRVSSVLDFRQVELTEERFDPNGQVVRSEQRTQEKSSGSDGVAGGVPGVTSNVPPGEAAESGQTSITTSQTKNETINYEISRTVSRVIEPFGTIKKLSVAVLVDGIYEPVKAGEKGEGTEGTRKYVPRSAEEMKRIEEIVKKAMGYSAERQDQVEVVNMPFGFDGGEEGLGSVAEAPAPVLAAVTPYIRYGVGALLFALILIFVVRPLLKALTARPLQPPAGSVEPQSLPMTVSQLEASMGAGSAQVLELARSDPKSTALVVQKWLGSTR